MTKLKQHCFRPITKSPQNVSSIVMTEINKCIELGKLKPGDKLPNENQLAKSFGVSRNSLREGLKSLAAIGILEIKHGQGIFVTDNPHFKQESLGNFSINKDRLYEVYKVRNILETQAVEWACIYASTSELEAIKEVLITTKQHLENSDENLNLLAQSDEKFHSLILKAANNSILEDIMYNYLDALLGARVESAKKGRSRKSLQEHLIIADALLERDIEKARIAMQMHLCKVQKDLLD